MNDQEKEIESIDCTSHLVGGEGCMCERCQGEREHYEEVAEECEEEEEDKVL